MRNKRLWLIIVAAVVVVALGAAGGGAYVLLRTKGSPRQTAEEFLAGWRHGDLAAMRARTVTPPADFDRYYQGLRTDLGATKVDVSLGAVTHHGKRATAPFTAVLTLPAGVWRYQGSLRLVTSDRKWKVAWAPESVHPDLHAGQRFTTSAKWLKRGSVLAADGTPIDGPDVSGSVQQLVGTTAPLTDKQAKKLGTPYVKGDVVGQFGIQQRYDKRLAGTPTTTISTVDASGHTVKAVGGFTGKPGQNVRTSLDLHVQRAMSSALQGQGKPTSMVAIRPATGQILAVGNIPGGFDRALQGTYPPGSTFKVVTAYALLQAGLSPSSSVQCPKTANVGGQVIHNSEGEGGTAKMTFKDALAESCNTAFALQTQKLLSVSKLSSAANALGFNQKIDPGVTATAGSFPAPTSDAEKAVAGFGQGRDLANALSIAGVAAGVADGTWRPPVFVTEPQVPQKAKPSRLDPTARGRLEGMMRAVVTSGTAKPAGLPSGTAGKTGTAEYGSAQNGKMPPTHAWFMGFRGDVAFAVVVEGGGFGAKAAAPIAARFLKAL
ncbi:penicillin-binding transpeptidase domain-containing protein [Actinoallomurus rhizosphaericola]|uniref:penicillin-binding transpeptidase domain-containing protein n=1 Tax=Actinoallomurus rhizosphaericola TaxID=2952536 RepID=UPI0020917986|nr:penicillin-binding transpeptidase domain-containing protein [Actinoallomurus rhizosphaericola]MCO5992253.1 penicillin-binding transpeptidase domain-containing protein [Actinoallomurus rhizosphaericola]